MDNKILVKTILDTEIDVLEGFLDKDREKVLIADSVYVSISDLYQLKGHLDTLKKIREKGWRNWKMMKNDSDIDATTAPVMELEYEGRKVENYPGQFENLVKERDNWREMYDEELKKNEELERNLMLANLDRRIKIGELEKENDELSRINSVRLGDINRLQDKVDKIDGYLHSIDDAYSEIPVNKLRPGYYDGMVKFCNDVFDILDDWKKS